MTTVTNVTEEKREGVVTLCIHGTSALHIVEQSDPVRGLGAGHGHACALRARRARARDGRTQAGAAGPARQRCGAGGSSVSSRNQRTLRRRETGRR